MFERPTRRAVLAAAPLLVAGIAARRSARSAEVRPQQAASAHHHGFGYWSTYKSDAMLRHRSVDAYLFCTDHMRIDADGAPNAYHPDDVGLDFNRNAGYPHSETWNNVLVEDPARPDRPYVQHSGPFAGYFLSKTSLLDPRLSATNPDKYVDASMVPYLVFPGLFYKLRGTGRLGDFGYAINLGNGRASPFIVADVGPPDARLGEVSIALAEALSGNTVDPKTGAGQPTGRVVYAVFRFSSSDEPAMRWRLPEGALAERTSQLLASIGGAGAVISCFA